MQLKKIKLAGFKSFVDPTVLELRSALMAIVGPNGCGKSNIIDAIRWVMGESSAKNLRGESMSDVIFNGSASRKPVSQASVELCFDNNQGLGGEYAQYSEISVRRVGSRDGESTYFLNGSRCRRKDITDLFLGTGLGPRSYAIIQQGMISRIIEAKPEELRGFIEEAAGVSLYKKRREESESRMLHTRENLGRVSDICQEIEKQLERLKRQSEAAERYQLFKQEQGDLEAALGGLRWRLLALQLKEKNAEIQVLAIELAQKNSLKARVELDLEKNRLLYSEKSDEWKIKQGAFYELGTQIVRLEEQLEHQRQRAAGLRQELSNNEALALQVEAQWATDCAMAQQLKTSLDVLSPKHQNLKNEIAEAEGVLQEVKEALRSWTQQYEAFQESAQQVQREVEVEGVRIEQFNRQAQAALLQIERLEKEQARINIHATEGELRQIEAEILGQEKQASQSTASLNDLLSQLTALKENLNKNAQYLSDLQEEYHLSNSRLASLTAIQAASLGKTNESLQKYLESQQLNQYPRLAEIIEVEPGYERAVETVLEDLLAALCIPDFSKTERVARVIETFDQGYLSFIDSNPAILKVTVEDNHMPGCIALVDQLKTTLPIHHLFKGIYVVEDWATAKRQLPTLKPGQSLMTPEGLWIGSHWLKIHCGQEGPIGSLEREQSIKELQHTVSLLKNKIEQTKNDLRDLQSQIEDLDFKRESLYQKQKTETQELKNLFANASALGANISHLREQQIRLQSEHAEQRQKLELLESETATARVRLEQARAQTKQDTEKRLALQTEGNKLQNLLNQGLEQERVDREREQSLRLEEQRLLTQQAAVEQGLARLSTQKSELLKGQTRLRQQLSDFLDPEQSTQKNLDQLLRQRLEAETVLNQARTELENLEQGLRAQEKDRSHTEMEIHRVQTRLEQYRLEAQTIQTRASGIEEQFNTLGLLLKEVVEQLSADLEEAHYLKELQQINKKIERLGPINLAALEEYQSELTRKEYLDAQLADLMEALKTLEEAIAKIDEETRTRFKQTFDQVNQAFEGLFPKLFGGGNAYLELDSDDCLNAGLSLMARPPGKRNSSIHLLSGGEKALTAVALVFAIFDLNPAPFCLLDEVDAPLDEANIGRFCDLVKQLSQTVQIIFITHNKAAVQIADHLVGVTMREAGVSRLVSVDIDAAVSLVEN